MENNSEIIKAKILKGLELSFQRLLEKKIKENGEFVFWKDGQVVHIKAKDLEK